MVTRAKYYFDVFERNKQIMSHATAREVRDKLNINIDVAQYAICGSVCRGKYTFQFCEDQAEDITLQERYNAVKSAFTRQMFNEWVTMNQRYGAIGDKA